MKKDFEKWWNRIDTFSLGNVFYAENCDLLEKLAWKAWKKATAMERKNNPNYVKLEQLLRRRNDYMRQ